MALLMAVFVGLMPSASDDSSDDVLGAGDAWDGTWVTWTEGSGTSASPYLIENEQHLAYLAQQVDSGIYYTGDYFKLERDMYLNEDSASYMDWGTTAPANIWRPIGDNSTSHKFEGHFDGAGHVVYGMYIPSGNYRGLFGHINDGSVSNLGIEESYVRGGDHIGGIAGYVHGNSVIDNCYNAGSIGGTERVGGIAGQAFNGSIISNCYNIGDINGVGANNSIGGIAGLVNVNSLVVNCYNTGDIKGIRIGGIVGNLNNSIVANSYNTGHVDGTNAGGVVGYVIMGEVINVYNIGEFTGGGSVLGNVSSITTNSYYYFLDSTGPGVGTGATNAFDYMEPFDSTYTVTSSGESLLDTLDDNVAGDSRLSSLDSVEWIAVAGVPYPVFDGMCAEVTVTVEGSTGWDVTITDAGPRPKGMLVTVLVDPGEDNTVLSVTDNGVATTAYTVGGDGKLLFQFVVHKDHELIVTLEGPEIMPPEPEPGVLPEKGGMSGLCVLLIVTIILLMLIFIGWCKRRNDEQ